MTTVIPSYVLLILKGLFLVGQLVYGVFAGVLVRQEQLMANVLEETFQPIIRTLVVGHLMVTIAVFILSLIIL